MVLSFKVINTLPQPEYRSFLPYGEAYFKLQYLHHDLEESISKTEQDEGAEQLTEDQVKIDLKYLRSLDSQDWKNQDHYRVLGIPHLRVNASIKDVKKAYKVIVLRCHPDKSDTDAKVNEEAFTCITKAYEQLCTVQGKRSYDSVDPLFDDDVPNITEYNKQKFFDVFGPVIERNSQWSLQKPVPLIGTDQDTIDQVDDFYNFWYNFKSWREYSYLDEEERKNAECKEERRYIDKINKTERLKKKKEESSRLHQLINNCYLCDPRIKKFDEEKKKRKLEAKLAKQEAYRKEQEALRLIKEEEERIKREEEERKLQIEKERADVEKKERQKQNKMLKTERKKLRDNVKARNYFADDDTALVKAMENLELLALNLSYDEIKKLNTFNNSASQFSEQYKSMLESYLKEQEFKTKENLAKAKQCQEEAKEQSLNSDKFSSPDIALLVKAVKIFPPGTVNRWNTIADYLNQHSTIFQSYESKDIIQKVKQLQSKEGDNLKNKINEEAYENLQRANKNRIDEVKAGGGISKKETLNSALNDAQKEGKKKEPWNSNEQKLLEEALKKYPQSTGPNRWDLISQHVGTRNKKDCMRRYKELVDLIKAKKSQN